MTINQMHLFPDDMSTAEKEKINTMKPNTWEVLGGPFPACYPYMWHFCLESHHETKEDEIEMMNMLDNYTVYPEFCNLMQFFAYLNLPVMLDERV